MYKIGELSRMCGLPVKTLRYYDSVGLLVPDEIDRFSGYRYYSAARLGDCNRIVALKELGFSLEEIRQHLSADSAESIAFMLDTKKKELENQLKITESQIKRLNTVKQIITEGEKKMFDIIIKKPGIFRICSVRQIFKTKEDALKKIEEIKSKLPRQIIGARTLIINYETEYHDTDFDLAACVEITGLPTSEYTYEDTIITLPGEAASLVCQSDELEEAYRSMSRQLNEQSIQIVGAFYEFYHYDGTVELKVPIYRTSEANPANDIHSELPFINDIEALGKWKLLDIVPSKEQFLYGHKKCGQTGWLLDELYFLKNGEPYWVIGGWTKGYIYYRNNEMNFRNQYTIETHGSRKLLFVRMNHYYDREKRLPGAPDVWIYEKVSDEIYCADDIKHRDFIGYPFETDEKLIGDWTAVNYYKPGEINNFDSAQKSRMGKLFVSKLSILPDGTCLRCQTNREVSLKWTKGYILDALQELSMSYEIRSIDQKEYLIVEWKSGDYVFGGKAPGHYVFVKA